MSPAVSIVLPVYNEEARVSSAIDRIARQTFEDFEIILVNDGSQDETGEIARSIHEPRLKVIDIEHAGVARALNEGIRQSSAQLIARHDADDVCTADRLELQLAFLTDHPEIDVLGSWASIREESSGRTMQFQPPRTDHDIKKYLPWKNPIVHSSVVARKSVLEGVGCYRTGIIWEDYDLWLRLRDQAVFANLAQPLVERMVRSDGHFRIRESRAHWDLYRIRSCALLDGRKSIPLCISTMTTLTKAFVLSAIGR